jgi:amidohydrolase
VDGYKEFTHGSRMKKKMQVEELKGLILNDAKKLESEIIRIRRHIHMHPETLFEEENTAKFIEQELERIGIESSRTAKTGVLAIINGSREGKVVALRADMDALNITEEASVSYKSQIEGKMHACGHDAHTAMLLGAARIIYKYRDQLSGQVKLVFQPAEEGGGGAKRIISEGHFKNVDWVFGLHVWDPLPTGVIGIRKGPIFASSDRFHINIYGKGGHAAAPHQTIDPTSVSADIYNALQKLISREINPFESCVLSVPVSEASEAHNIIPASTKISGTLRTFNPEVRSYLIDRIRDVVKGYSSAWRCTAKVEFDPIYYPAVINDEEAVGVLFKILKGVGTLREMDQTMIGEDFSFYLQETKGAFLTLGNRNVTKGIVFPHHHPKFQVDEDILWRGTVIYSFLGFFNSFLI